MGSDVLSTQLGFRPGRSAHQAVAQAQHYIADGYDWVVDLDLEKFFDRVNHDKLMGRIAQRVDDPRLRGLIRAFLNAGVMENGLVGPSVDGTPQGGPLSPLLSNLVLDDLDRELERRGLRFVRYADDCNIYVRSARAGHRVMDRVTRFLATRLKLTVNASKSAVARPQERTFLGFTFTGGPTVARAIAPKAVRRFKTRVREITRRAKGVSLETTIAELARTCGAGATISASAKRPRRWCTSRAGSACDCERRSGDSGEHPDVVAPRGSRWGFVRDWPSIRPAAGSDPGTSHAPRPSRWGCPMPTSTRSAFPD